MNLLQIGDEFSSREACNLGTNTTQVFGFTAGFDTIAHLDFLAARFTLPCHQKSRFIGCSNCLLFSEAWQYNQTTRLREAVIIG